MKTVNKLWLIVLALALFAPLGIAVPQYFRSGSAWGEWGAEEIKELVGYIPSGLARISSLWNSPVPDYAFKGWEGGPTAYLVLAYAASAFIGIIFVAGLTLLISVFIKKEGRD